MKITAELYKKEVQILLTFQPDDFKNQYKCILNHKEATDLMKHLYTTLNEPTLVENGFKLV